MFSQQFLKFTFNNSESKLSSDDFCIHSSNVIAYRAITKNILWYGNRLLIVGSEGTGKTHLVRIWKNKMESDGYSVVNANSDIVNTCLSEDSCFFLENIEDLDEEKILDTINISMSRGIKLLMTARYLHPYKSNDLKSRIRSTYTAVIRDHDSSFVGDIILKEFSDRQIKVSEDVIDYVTSNIVGEKIDFIDIKRYIDRIHDISMKNKEKIDLRFLKSIKAARYFN